jgi:hypothetical protein
MNEQYEAMTRLLDGEMTAQERHVFLQDLDRNHPQGWRDLALGFVENQMITEALRSDQAGEIDHVFPLKKPSPWNIARVVKIAAVFLLGLFLGNMIWSGYPQSEPSRDIALNPEQVETSKASTRNIALAGNVQPIEKLNATLKEQGYKPQMTHGYIEAQLADGRQLIVPISHLAMNGKK